MPKRSAYRYGCTVLQEALLQGVYIERIYYGGHCPICHGTIKAEQLHIDQPLQDRVNDFSKQLKDLKQDKKIPMDEYVQKKGVLTVPQTKQTALFTSFRHNVKPTFTISCLNCNEMGHVFKDCPKLELKDEPPTTFSSTQVINPSNVADTPVIVLSPKRTPTTPIFLDPSYRIALDDVQPKRHLRDFKREHRKRRKKQRKSSHTSSSSSLSRSRSRTARKRRRRRSRSKSKRKSFRRSKSPLSVSSAAREHSSADHRKRASNRSEPNRRRRRGDLRYRIPLVSGIKVEKHNSKQRIWPAIRKPPRPNKSVALSPF